MNINSNIYKTKVKDFIPKHVFECGQCFRWTMQDDGKYTGVAGGRAVSVYMENEDTLVIENCTEEDFHSFWHDYFDLGRDYGEIKEAVSKDDIMKEAVRFGSGIRLLKQDFNEVLISFIISSNNRIPRIMKSVETLSKLYGEKILWGSREFFSFPTINTLASLSLEDINLCRAGFRCKYISNTAKALSMGRPDTCKECTLDCHFENKLCRKALLPLSGIGPKVADCILLFSGSDYSSFPTDVWVKRVMEELYFKREASLKEIAAFARDYWGEYAGFAQQYLFYYARENGIGV